MTDLTRMRISIPLTVRDWLESRPPSLPADTALEYLIDLAQHFPFETEYDIESLVETYSDFLLDEARFHMTEEEFEYMNEYSDFFREIYYPATSLFTAIGLDNLQRNDWLIRLRLSVLMLTRDYRTAILQVVENILSHVGSGEFNYLRYEEER